MRFLPVAAAAGGGGVGEVPVVLPHVAVAQGRVNLSKQ